MEEVKRIAAFAAGILAVVFLIALGLEAPKQFLFPCALLALGSAGLWFYADEEINAARRAAQKAALHQHLANKKADERRIRANEVERRKEEEAELKKAIQPWLNLCAIFKSGYQIYEQRDPTGVDVVEWRRAQLDDGLWPFFRALQNATPKDIGATPKWYRDLLSQERPLSDIQFDDSTISFEASDGEQWEQVAAESLTRLLRSTRFVNRYFVRFENPSQAECDLWNVIDELTGVLEDPPDEFPAFPETTSKELRECCTITEQADDILAAHIAAALAYRDKIYPPDPYELPGGPDDFWPFPYTNQLAQLAADRKRIVLAEAKTHLIECRKAFWDAVRFRYSQWVDIWNDDPPQFVFNDECYIAAAAPDDAARLQPPLLPIPGVSEFLWWRHHVLFTQLNKPDYLFLGCCMAEPSKGPSPLNDYQPRFPFYLHKPILNDHLHLAGRTGGGKTSLFLLPIILQLIHGHKENGGKRSKPSPLVIIDLAGDEVLFQETKRAAEERGQTFRFFTIEKGRATYRFNPFTSFNPNRHGAPELTQVFMEALGLDHGPGYGRSFYTKVAQDLLTDSFTRNPNIRSFEELSIEIQKSARRPTFIGSKDDALEVYATVNNLIHYPQLKTAEGEDNAPDVIHLPRVLEQREVAYFWLPAPLAAISVREIGCLVLLGLRAAGFDRRQDKPKDPRQAYLFMDEFQKLAGESFPNALQQLRHQRVGVILANQGVNELKLPNGFDLRPGLSTNTRAKIYFDVPEPQTFRFFNQLQSGETPAALPFPSENSFDATALYSQGNSRTTTTGQSIGEGTSLVENESESAGTSSSKSKSRSESSGGSRSVSESYGYSETVIHKGDSPRFLPGQRNRPPYPAEDHSGDSMAYTLSRTIGESSSSSWSTSTSEGTSEGQSSSTSKGKSRGVTRTRTDSTSQGTGETFNQPTYGSLYSGFAVRTTWHISAEEKTAVEKLPWPNVRSIPKAKALPEVKRQAKALEAAKASDNKTLNTLYDTTARPSKNPGSKAPVNIPPTPKPATAPASKNTTTTQNNESDNAKLQNLFDTGRAKRPGTGGGRRRS